MKTIHHFEASRKRRAMRDDDSPAPAEALGSLTCMFYLIMICIHVHVLDCNSLTPKPKAQIRYASVQCKASGDRRAVGDAPAEARANTSLISNVY